MDNIETNKVLQGFSVVAIRIDNRCEEKFRKILSDEWYLFNDWYVLRNGSLVKNKNVYTRNLYGQNISIQAIVGKNGSGKSSVMELVYRIVNNLSLCMMQGSHTSGAWPLKYIDGIYADLYFESGGLLGCVSIQGYLVQYAHGDVLIEYRADQMRGTLDDEESRTKLEMISRSFCFTLVYNYALMALNPWDYQHEFAMSVGESQKSSWLDSLYNKNDGYTAAIGFEPYRGHGIIDLNKQKSLCMNRLLGVMVDSKNNKSPFFDGYSCEDILLNFDAQYLSRKVNADYVNIVSGGRHPLEEFSNLFRNANTFTAIILQYYNINTLNLQDKLVCAAAMYVVIKTLQIAELYPQFDKYQEVGKIRYYARETDSFDKHFYDWYPRRRSSQIISSKQSLADLVAAILADSSHITLKVRQTLHFLEVVKLYYEEEGYDWMCPKISRIEDYQKLFYRKEYEYGKKINHSPQSIIEFCPPPFFKKEVFLNRNKTGQYAGQGQSGSHIPYDSLSSGERQFLQTAVSVIYHIRNIISVQDTAGFAKYYNVNLFLDEVEVCFHPEYQQKFIYLLLNMIQDMNLTKGCNINIIIATHSPFILSDIPKSNILYLENGKVPKRADGFVDPFCANVNQLLRQSFFLSSGLMGYFAKGMVEDLLLYLKPDERGDRVSKRVWNEDTSKAFINMIGEPLLKNSLMNLHREKFGKSDDELILWHKQELERLSQERMRNEANNNH